MSMSHIPSPPAFDARQAAQWPTTKTCSKLPQGCFHRAIMQVCLKDLISISLRQVRIIMEEVDTIGYLDNDEECVQNNTLTVRRGTLVSSSDRICRKLRSYLHKACFSTRCSRVPSHARCTLQTLRRAPIPSHPIPSHGGGREQTLLCHATRRRPSNMT